jgi:zinc protease
MLSHRSKLILKILFFLLFASKFLSPESLEIRNAQEFYLSNKLRVIFIQEKDFPLVKLRMVIFNGESSSFPGMEGLATLTARSFFKGSILLPEQQLSRLLSYYGVKITCEVREEKTSFSISVPKDNFERFLTILNDLLLRNTFPEDSLNEERNLIIREMRRRNEDPSYLSYSFFYKNLLKRTPYPKIFFTEESLKKITSQNCLTFLKRYYTPNNSALFVFGDFDSDNLKRTLEKWLAGWKERSLFYPYVPSIPPVRENIVSILNLPLQDSFFIMGNVLHVNSIDEMAGLLILNEVIGGSDFSRISLKFKDTLGYCNFIESGVIFHKKGALFFVSGMCRNEKVKEVILGILSEIKDLKERRIEEKELKSVKDYVIGDIIVKNSDIDLLLSSLEDAILLGYSLNYMDRILKGIERLSQENFLSIANKYFKIESNFIVVAGRKEALVDSLKDLGKMEIYFKINNSWEREK